jgi:hypothetical protein
MDIKLMFIYIDIYKYIKRLLPIATLCIKESIT